MALRHLRYSVAVAEELMSGAPRCPCTSPIVESLATLAFLRALTRAATNAAVDTARSAVALAA